MEFDNNLREDFPFLSSLFSDHNPSKPELTNGFSLEASSSKGLVHDFQHFDDHDHFPLTGFNLNPLHVDDQYFNVEGSSSDSLSGIQSPWPVFNAYGNINANMHGFESSSVGLVWDNPQNNLVQPMAGQISQIYLPLNNIQELGSANIGRLGDDVSCITLESGYHRRAYQKKRKRVHIRKASKVQKKHNIIKGQWTPQEDRCI